MIISLFVASQILLQQNPLMPEILNKWPNHSKSTNDIKRNQSRYLAINLIQKYKRIWMEINSKNWISQIWKICEKYVATYLLEKLSLNWFIKSICNKKMLKLTKWDYSTKSSQIWSKPSLIKVLQFWNLKYSSYSCMILD